LHEVTARIGNNPESNSFATPSRVGIRHRYQRKNRIGIDEDNAARMMTLHRDNGLWRKPEPVEDSP